MISSQSHLTYIPDEDAFAIDPGTAVQIALWGGGPGGEPLRVQVHDASSLQVTAVTPPLKGSDLRTVHLKSPRIGTTTLSARLADGRTWATANVAVGFTPGRMVAATKVPLSGEIPFAAGMGALVRIPIPGTNGLCIELGHRGWAPKTGSTSTVFIQDALGKRNLRLDYGYNVKTGTVNYHWNQKGTFQQFGIADHTPVGTSGRVVYKAARYLRFAGRAVAIVGAAVDVYSIVVADRALRQATKVVSGWAGAWIRERLIHGGPYV